MSKVAAPIGVFVVIWFGFYLTGAFMAASFDIKQWSDIGRSLCGFMGTASAFFGALAVWCERP